MKKSIAILLHGKYHAIVESKVIINCVMNRVRGFVGPSHITCSMLKGVSALRRHKYPCNGDLQQQPLHVCLVHALIHEQFSWLRLCQQ